MIKRIIVTGAYGLVGSNICKTLERVFPELELIKVKFDELNITEDLPVDFIIHAAGYGQPSKFSKDKLATIEINTTYTNKLFSMLKPGGKFLFISSSEVYSGAQPPYKETDIGTTNPQHPRACYIESKRCGEAIVMAHRERGVDAKIARLALAYGPGTKRGDGRVLYQFIEQALETKTINLLDKGDAVRTYCYIDDAVEMLIKILFFGEQSVYNVGGTSTVTIKQLAEKIAELIPDTKIVLGEAGLDGAPQDVKVCLDRITEEFPIQFVPLETGLKNTIEWQKSL